MFNRSGSICPNSIKNRNLGRLVRAVRFEMNKQLLQQFQLENECLFQKKCCDSISHFATTRNYSSAGKFSDDIRNYIADGLMNIHFRRNS